MRELVSELAGWLGHGRNAVLAVILHQAGSTPRGSGSMMIVRDDGAMAGSVGGGPLEGRVLRTARQMFDAADAPGGDSRLLRFDLGNGEAADAGMVCGGQAVVLLDHLLADADTAAALRLLDAELDAGRSALLALDFRAHGDRLEAVSRRAVAGAETPEADAGMTEALAEALAEARHTGLPATRTGPGRLAVAIPLAALHTAILFGAGHVALHTARLAAEVGFRTVVVDDRAEFANSARFPRAEVVVAPGFDDCFHSLAVGPETFILVLTRGHVHDKTVLAQALRTDAAYLGMIGSRRKRDATYEALAAEGHDPASFGRVHCPIGLDIEAETPEEIAVSIVAEMIAARAALRNGRGGA